MVLVVEKTLVIVSRCQRLVRASSAQPPHRSSANSPSTVSASEAPRSWPLSIRWAKTRRSGSKRGMHRPSTQAVDSLMANAPDQKSGVAARPNGRAGEQRRAVPKNPKSEARNPKQIRSMKSEIRNSTLLDRTFRSFYFGLIRVCFEFRHSDFGFGGKAATQRLARPMPHVHWNVQYCLPHSWH